MTANGSLARAFAAPVILGLLTLATYAVLREIGMIPIPRADPLDRALLVGLPVAASSLVAIAQAIVRRSEHDEPVSRQPNGVPAPVPRPKPVPPPRAANYPHVEVHAAHTPSPPDPREPPAPHDPPAPPPPAAVDDERVKPEALLQFVREINASPEVDRLHATLSRTLPSLLGFPDVWVITRVGPRQQIIHPEGAKRARLLSDVQHWMTFPLVREGTTFGLLGIGVGQQGMDDARRHFVTEVASLVAQALQTSDAFERMREASTVDALTGCSTRADGLHRLQIELRRAQRSGKPAAVLLLDLDHFKSVNDRFGHPCGDATLAQVGRIMMQTLRASDIRCRWGGEEFLVVLPETGLEAAKRVADALRRRIAEARLVYGEEEVQVTVSTGATVTRSGEVETHNLLLRVDAALYRAKNDGRNCVRAVIGDLHGTPVATPPKGSRFLAFPDRRDPSRPDRRRFAGPGRRRTDRRLSNGS
jgi:diguanylate cyclase (GGDEF)-like protein